MVLSAMAQYVNMIRFLLCCGCCDINVSSESHDVAARRALATAPFGASVGNAAAVVAV